MPGKWKIHQNDVEAIFLKLPQPILGSFRDVNFNRRFVGIGLDQVRHIHGIVDNEDSAFDLGGRA